MDLEKYDSAILNDDSNFKSVYDNLKSGSFIVCLTNVKKYHRTAIQIEDVGFEIRDMIIYLNKCDYIPIVLARKPLSEKTIVENILKHGTGGINIDDSRIEIDLDIDDKRLGGGFKEGENTSSIKGRFPANLLHDGSDEVEKIFPDTHKAGNVNKSVSGITDFFTLHDKKNVSKKYKREIFTIAGDIGGSSSRFFKELKTKEDLIKYLSVLITPKEGKLYNGI